MTTVVASREEMACDLMGTIGQEVKFKSSPKIQKFEYGSKAFPELGPFIIGFSGRFEQFIQYLDFLVAPEEFKKAPKFSDQLLFLTKSKKIYYSSSGGTLLEMPEKFFAIGSGTTSAMGAMHAGATPKDAVLAASKVDPFSGMGVKVMSFK